MYPKRPRETLERGRRKARLVLVGALEGVGAWEAISEGWDNVPLKRAAVLSVRVPGGQSICPPLGDLSPREGKLGVSIRSQED